MNFLLKYKHAQKQDEIREKMKGKKFLMRASIFKVWSVFTGIGVYFIDEFNEDISN